MAILVALVSIPLLTAAICWYTEWAERAVVSGEPIRLLRHR